VYIKQPKGFQVKGQESKVCRLQNVFYDLWQALRAWYTKIDTYLRSQGLTQGEIDVDLYFFNEGNKIMLLILHVDDVYITSNHIPKLDWIWSEIKQCFEMTNLVATFIRLEYFFHPNGITIIQCGYARQMFIDLGMQNVI
jgi:hypothetical protein